MSTSTQVPQHWVNKVLTYIAGPSSERIHRYWAAGSITHGPPSSTAHNSGELGDRNLPCSLKLPIWWWWSSSVISLPILNILNHTHKHHHHRSSKSLIFYEREREREANLHRLLMNPWRRVSQVIGAPLVGWITIEWSFGAWCATHPPWACWWWCRCRTNCPLLQQLLMLMLLFLYLHL